jgi:hypothetical protein
MGVEKYATGAKMCQKVDLRTFWWYYKYIAAK